MNLASRPPACSSALRYTAVPFCLPAPQSCPSVLPHSHGAPNQGHGTPAEPVGEHLLCSGCSLAGMWSSCDPRGTTRSRATPRWNQRNRPSLFGGGYPLPTMRSGSALWKPSLKKVNLSSFQLSVTKGEGDLHPLLDFCLVLSFKKVIHEIAAICTCVLWAEHFTFPGAQLLHL